MPAITHIDLPIKRLSTGPVKLGADWPGLFIRGDESIALANTIDAAQCSDFLPCNGPGAVLLQQVIDLLKSCEVPRNA